MSDVTAIRLDMLFAEQAEACRAFLVAWTNARPSPSLASPRAHDKLMDAQNEVERVVAEIADIFARREAAA